MQPQELWSRITSDVEFMSQNYERTGSGQHQLKAHIQKNHKAHLKHSVKWTLEKQFDLQTRQSVKHVSQKLPYMHHVYSTSTQYFEELRQTCNIPSSQVWWPCNTLGYCKALEYSFVLKHPGLGTTVINCKPPPSWLAEAMDNNPDSVVIGYHGTAPQNANGIARDGIRPTPGAGSDELMKVWGIDIRGSYTAKTAAQAWTYPQEGQDSKKRHLCGYLIAEDWSFP